MTEKEQTLPKNAAPALTLSIVIPVYNGAASVAELVRALEELRIDGGHEIILVNDDSPDDSLNVCRSLVDRARVPITLIELARNFGEHNAVMAGLRHASGAHVITMDDDLQNPPEEVERLLAFAQGSGKEVIYTFYDDKRHPIWRNLGSRFANRVADFVLEKPRGLYLSSFRCMSAFVVREITRYEGPFRGRGPAHVARLVRPGRRTALRVRRAGAGRVAARAPGPAGRCRARRGAAITPCAASCGCGRACSSTFR